ncbi:hypothetical protein CO155_01260 [Candidatus Pacearchaeota archaeon CG_4_9_14_3_um_filter_35_19]|nr:hypothetical protein [Candidatus Pacearchaeota archaeon]OIO41991.1 MAG: hypothetical protein AUJ63_04545 [Candidatus Pacearchaeota archaeon CG1_02_35_32]PJA70253.1 MAG: hypothetical protein CO155_01260 [Candidatus Pacearchaeota archaeon CG_4_9_14_3_um_filter_35_19]PJB93809.1 MAG: hypothetical protein CO081_04445 [Candidatus Pacearchaeota archaeon CG_4_9_14_0_8_um_filter_35_24]
MTEKMNKEFVAQIVVICVLALLISFNVGRMYSPGLSTGIRTVSASDVIPTGMPSIYGEELGISYDDISPNDPRLADATINKMSEYEDTQLNEEQMTHYINIAGSISCEYCCGAESIIFSNGERACGCAHSYAMRGLAKYLLINHPEMGDDEILTELAKWKTLFFPGIMEAKAQALKDNGIEFNYINLGSNAYRGIEKGQGSGGMVGGC